MVYDMGSSSMDQIQSNDRPVWDMLPGDVARRPAARKWRNLDRSERTNGSETPLKEQGQERHQGEPANRNTELIPKHNNPIGIVCPIRTTAEDFRAALRLFFP